MASERSIRRYRNWYAKLLRVYPKSHRERFNKSMEQTFHDLLRERATAGRGLFGFVLWAFVETSGGIMRENLTHALMQTNLLRIAMVTGLILLAPLIAMQFTDEVNWDSFDFVFMGALVFGTGLAYDLVARRGGTIAYRVAVGIACATGFVLVFINAAAGIIGDGPVNLLYLGVLAVGFVGAFVARFEPRPMALALYATAVAQMLVPVIALAIWKAGWQELLMDPHSPHPPFHPGVAPVFGLNAVFAMLWIVSGLLFRHAGDPRPKTRPEEQGQGTS
jgi:hypothetical protein